MKPFLALTELEDDGQSGLRGIGVDARLYFWGDPGEGVDSGCESEGLDG